MRMHSEKERNIYTHKRIDYSIKERTKTDHKCLKYRCFNKQRKTIADNSFGILDLSLVTKF